ncbi:MAG: AIR carboxylase family protein [bacterium]|nr:AIR carboxylase family protein [bacterium]
MSGAGPVLHDAGRLDRQPAREGTCSAGDLSSQAADRQAIRDPVTLYPVQTPRSRSLLPVIGIPLAAGTLGGLDALLSTVQMPPGVPVTALLVPQRFERIQGRGSPRREIAGDEGDRQQQERDGSEGEGNPPDGRPCVRAHRSRAADQGGDRKRRLGEALLARPEPARKTECYRGRDGV